MIFQNKISLRVSTWLGQRGRSVSLLYLLLFREHISQRGYFRIFILQSSEIIFERSLQVSSLCYKRDIVVGMSGHGWGTYQSVVTFYCLFGPSFETRDRGWVLASRWWYFFHDALHSNPCLVACNFIAMFWGWLHFCGTCICNPKRVSRQVMWRIFWFPVSCSLILTIRSVFLKFFISFH